MLLSRGYSFFFKILLTSVLPYAMRSYDWLICKLFYKTAGIRNKHDLFRFQRVCSIFSGVSGYVTTENGSHGYFVKHKGKYEKILPLWFHWYGWWSHASNLAFTWTAFTWTNLHGLAFISWHHFLAHSIGLGFLEKLSYLSTTHMGNHLVHSIVPCAVIRRPHG